MKTYDNPAAQPRIYVIIVNWNGSADTIACLESLIEQEYENFRIVVCDNNSNDGSIERISEWAATTLPLLWPGRRLLRMYGSDVSASGQLDGQIDAQLILINNSRNLGYAGGNNVGLAFALAQGDMDFAWLLNNDTVVDVSCLALLVEKIQKTGAAICGSTLLDYRHRNIVQARGARYNKWFARTHSMGYSGNFSDPVDEDAYAEKMDYLIGASMLVSTTFLRDVGLMSEQYFLYFEELDWIVRAGRRHFFAYASRSVVYHRGGASTGATFDKKSLVGEYYGTRARILFTRKFYPYLLPTVLIAIIASMINQALRGRCAIARTILLAALDGIRGRTGARIEA